MTCGIFLLRLARGLRRVVIVLDCKRRADAADMKAASRTAATMQSAEELFQLESLPRHPSRYGALVWGLCRRPMLV